LPEAVHSLTDVFEHTCDQSPESVSVVVGSADLTYAELDRRANQLAHLLIRRGVSEGSRVGILLGRSVDTYVALLGVLKAGAAYVPLDPLFPADRVAHIAADAALRALVTTSSSREVTAGLSCGVLELDRVEVEAELLAQPTRRADVDIDPSSLCYVIYTSGSTGKPKGVAVSHANIVNFLRVATPIYGVTSADRVYQGMSISFDFHLEEMWPAWVAGATLVAGPTDSRRFGQGLTDFLVENRITVFCSVPTLLTTLESDPETVRCLLVSGEAMPADLVRRWWRPERRILNCYGPTETTVSSSCCELLPDRPVTLGKPFPTYTFYVLDDDLRPVDDGDVGEICIGGPGTAVGYLNRPELTAERFIANPIPSQRTAVPRIYRTGDLGRSTPSGEFEYLGRIDTQVKIRGYRIELGEIEQVIREDEAVENAVVATLERDGIVQDLVGYITVYNHAMPGGEAELRDRLHASLRRRLPPYMIPSFVEVLDVFPLLAADKVNRAALPPPVSAPLGSRSGGHVPAETPIEADLAAVWAEILSLPQVSVEDDFFCDLGGHSLTAARLISRLRQQPRLSGLAMGDIYANPTVRSLALFVEADLAPPAAEETPAPPGRRRRPGAGTAGTPCAPGRRRRPGSPPSTVSESRPPLLHSSARVWACGAAQAILIMLWLLLWAPPGLLLIYAIVLFEASLAVPIVGLPPAVADLLADPTMAETIGIFITWLLWILANLFLFPVLVSRLVMRGVRPGWYPLWGITYLRFWFYGRASGLAPLAMLSGTPFESGYYRLLGAKIGRRSQLASSTIALPMFLELGDGVSINHGAIVQPFVIESGWLRLAPIKMGTGSFLGCGSMVLAGAEIGDGASVGDKSLVHADARIPAGEHWAGSPIKRLNAASPLLESMAERADYRRWTISVLSGYVGGMVLLTMLPLGAIVPSAAIVGSTTIGHGLLWGIASVFVAGPLFVFVTCVLLILAKRAVLPRVQPGIYPARGWFGVREWLSKNIVGLSLGLVRTIYCTLYVIPFLRGLGMRIGRWCEIAVPSFIDPDLTVTGDQTFLAGGIVIAPPVYHHGCVALNLAEMGRRSFLGNVALLPGTSRMGDNSLLGVHSVAPTRIDPETTWLGSPAIFFPRRQESQQFADKLTYTPTPAMIAVRLALEIFRVTLPAIIGGTSTLLSLWITIKLLGIFPPLTLLLVLPVIALGLGFATALEVVLLKWLIIGRYRPRTEPYWGTWVRATELITGLFETIAAPTVVTPFAGTPLLPPILRLFGTHVGRRVYITTSGGTEFDLISIGDDAVIADGAITQTHLFEDRVMKMSRVEVGAGATVGASSIVLYDATVEPGASLESLSLVMKGETLPAAGRWRGIPARRV
jgi:non-ribosomal peptide synthetase-like protein